MKIKPDTDTPNRNLESLLLPKKTIQLSKYRLAEEEGFEPPVLSYGGFQDRCLRPLGHSSFVTGPGV